MQSESLCTSSLGRCVTITGTTAISPLEEGSDSTSDTDCTHKNRKRDSFTLPELAYIINIPNQKTVTQTLIYPAFTGQRYNPSSLQKANVLGDLGPVNAPNIKLETLILLINKAAEFL